MKKANYGIGLWAFNPCLDRFCASGYKDALTTKKKIELLASVKMASGVELTYPDDFQEMENAELKKYLQKSGLQCIMVSANVFGDRKWMFGSIGSSDKKVRRDAIGVAKRAKDSAEALGCDRITLWLGQDGFDYPFQINYREHLSNLVSGIKEVAEYKPKMKVCVEYKIKEPRTHITIGTAAKALLIAKECGENVGVTVDWGHAMMAYENPAAEVAMLGDKLFHIHFNDSYRYWDDDMIAGSVHTIELVEFMFWLDEIGYDGWYSLDIFPYREDAIEACRLSIENIESARKLAGKIDRKKLLAALETQEAVKSQRVVRELLYPK
jgi:xylose isomerase